MKLKRCVNKANCELEDRINEVMRDSRFSLVIVNSEINMKNYDKPIQYVIDDGFYWELFPSLRKKTDIFIRQNEASFEDNYIQLGFPQEKEFYQVVKTENRYESESTDGDILSLYFRFDRTSDQYERKIFSLGEVLGLAGGFHGAFIMIGGIFFFIFSERLFVSAILKKIYQIDTWQENEKLDKDLRPDHKKNYKDRKLQYRQDGRKMTLPYTESEKYHAEAFKDLKNTSNPEHFNDEEMEKIEHSMRERRVFKYGYGHILHYILCCVI